MYNEFNIFKFLNNNIDIQIGRSLFQQPEPGRVVSLSNGLDLWVGVFQSVVIGSKPYLNIDGNILI